ncbi:MAG: quinolinate synthase [Desulfurococcales archaeon ex4484_58]|nr:MAG: quinolinate synthase [Desulfurococcales archaeon ex4484_58]
MSVRINELIEEINVLREKKRAYILAHNYQEPEIQNIADYVGDSLEMAKRALEIDSDVIVVAGVSFMAEMVAVLNPDKIILHPEPTAGCPLAEFLTPQMIRDARENCRGCPVVLYVNSYLASKEYADYIVTSASAYKLISKLGVDRVLFGPDKNLADHVAGLTGIEVIPLPRYGHCPVHEYLIDEYYVGRAINRYPNAKVLIHPEAPRNARLKADFIGSTSQMLRAIGEIKAEAYLLGTEEGLTYRARKLYPDKRIYPVNPKAICIDMKKITLKKIRDSLDKLEPRVRIERSRALKVREILERSIELIK